MHVRLWPLGLRNLSVVQDFYRDMTDIGDFYEVGDIRGSGYLGRLHREVLACVGHTGTGLGKWCVGVAMSYAGRNLGGLYLEWQRV